jgi:hypothetical protein
MKISIKSLIIGTVVTFISLGFSYVASVFKLVELSHILYWQGWWLQTFLPCLNIGNLDDPGCEGTPLNFIVFILGIPFGIFLYSLVAFVLLSVWIRRESH